jgi:hypothetical protein
MKITVVQKEDLPKKLRYKGLVPENIRKTLKEIETALVPAVQEGIPEASGTLRDSIYGRVDMHGGNGDLTVTSNLPDIAAAVEFGSRPHWAPISREPTASDLEHWVASKGGDDRMLYMVRRKIAAVGTAPHSMFAKGLVEAGPAINKALAKLGLEIIWALSERS